MTRLDDADSVVCPDCGLSDDEDVNDIGGGDESFTHIDDPS